MDETVNQELLNNLYSEMKAQEVRLLRIDEDVAVLMEDNTVRLETMLVNHISYHRHRASENAEWLKWDVRP